MSEAAIRDPMGQVPQRSKLPVEPAGAVGVVVALESLTTLPTPAAIVLFGENCAADAP